MSDRKVLNHYYPPDFDPETLRRETKARKKFQPRSKLIPVNMMIPFRTLRCVSCGHYIGQGTKVNAKKVCVTCTLSHDHRAVHTICLFACNNHSYSTDSKETVTEKKYLDIPVFRFYFRCPNCASTITFVTDPQNADYQVESGAKRGYEPWKQDTTGPEGTAQDPHQVPVDPLQQLENKAEKAKQEHEDLDKLHDLVNLRKQQSSINVDMLVRMQQQKRQREEERAEQEDEELIRSLFPKRDKSTIVKRIQQTDDRSESDE